MSPLWRDGLNWDARHEASLEARERSRLAANLRPLPLAGEILLKAVGAHDRTALIGLHVAARAAVRAPERARQRLRAHKADMAALALDSEDHVDLLRVGNDGAEHNAIGEHPSRRRGGRSRPRRPH
jgi:hypothetical protein